MPLTALALAFQLSAPQTLPAAPDVTTLVARARSARLQQETQLASYEAIARQRMSSSIGLAGGITGAGIASAVRGGAIGALNAIGSNRLAARFESVARVGWDHRRGAFGEVIAARSVVPLIGDNEPMPEGGASPAIVLPFYPGRDRLWPMSEMANDLPKFKDWLAHPLDAGADSIYRFSLGDSLNIRLPDKQLIRLREIRVQPRRPSGQLMVGSLWVDVSTGSLVRAAYRPSMPVDLWPFMEREIRKEDDANIAKKFGPYTGVIREIIVDHGLYDGKFWLPKTRIANAEGTAKVGRVTLTVEQTFEYRNVASLRPGEVRVDSVTHPEIDPRTGRVRRSLWYGTIRSTRVCRPAGDTSSRWSADSLLSNDNLTVRMSEGVAVRVIEPCRRADLLNSPELPGSIYSPGEELFPKMDFEALRKDAESALAMDKQAEWNPQPVALHYGIEAGMLRYNRVEGLSAGISFDREMGQGYTQGGLARIGLADRQPLGELFMARSNVSNVFRGAAYRRLDAANDWGDPLGLGASISAAMFGRDDGFYFRTLGAEVSGTHRSAGDALVWSWRLFGERQTTAKVSTDLSLTGRRSIENLAAVEGWYGGAMTGAAYTWGLDPRGLRLSGNTRLEGAGGKLSYGRAMTELTLMRGLGDRGQLVLTGAGGTSAGDLPAQRHWYLGGPFTVHGHQAGAVSGDAFWMARGQLSHGQPMFRPVVFGDIGWAGLRNDLPRSPNPMSGAGIGFMTLDGLVRLDVSRGIAPTQRFRVDFYFEIR